MKEIARQIASVAKRFDIQIIYAFGSRAKEALDTMRGRTEKLAAGPSDLDIAIKPRFPLDIETKVSIAIAFEDLFEVNRVDLVVLPEARTFLALEAVTGELLFAEDEKVEAEYQLYVMRKAAELLPYERARQRMILGRE